MRGFNKFFHMNTEDVKRYVVDVLGLFSPEEDLVLSEPYLSVPFLERNKNNFFEVLKTQRI